jgi:hypothetical protein
MSDQLRTWNINNCAYWLQNHALGYHEPTRFNVFFLENLICVNLSYHPISSYPVSVFSSQMTILLMLGWFMPYSLKGSYIY